MFESFGNVSYFANHANKGNSDAVGQNRVYALGSLEAECAVQRLTRKRRHQFQTLKAGRLRRLNTGCHDPGGDTLPRPVGMDKEGPYACRITGGIKQNIFPGLSLIAAVQSPAAAPAAAADQRQLGFDDKVRAVGDELRVRAEDMTNGALDLRPTVIAATERADGDGNQFPQRRQIVRQGKPQGNRVLFPIPQKHLRHPETSLTIAVQADADFGEARFQNVGPMRRAVH